MIKFAWILAFCVTFIYGMYFNEAIHQVSADQYRAEFKTDSAVFNQESKICVDREALLFAIAILEDTGNAFVAKPIIEAFNQEDQAAFIKKMTEGVPYVDEIKQYYDYQKAHEAK